MSEADSELYVVDLHDLDTFAEVLVAEQRAYDAEHGVIDRDEDGNPVLGDVGSRDDLVAVYERSYPETSAWRRWNEVGQLWSLLLRTQEGELVALPLHTTGTVAVGHL